MSSISIILINIYIVIYIASLKYLFLILFLVVYSAWFILIGHLDHHNSEIVLYPTSVSWILVRENFSMLLPVWPVAGSQWEAANQTSHVACPFAPGFNWLLASTDYWLQLTANALLVKAHWEWSIEILELCLPFYGKMSLSLSN